MGAYANITLDMVYQKLQVIEEELKEINEDLHRVKPEFSEKLKKAEKGKFRAFANVEELARHVEGRG